jgi:RHH-type transcriptional regulator, rel operon repressor / antitoxin RelB
MFGTMATVEMKPVSFRTPSTKLEKIDEIADAQQRDRSFVLNEAIDQYLDLQDYHRGLIEQGLRDAEAGRVHSHEEVGRLLAKQRASRKAEASH